MKTSEQKNLTTTGHCHAMLVDYQRGLIDRNEAISRFSFLTGFPSEVAEKFIFGSKKNSKARYPLLTG